MAPPQPLMVVLRGCHACNGPMSCRCGDAVPLLSGVFAPPLPANHSEDPHTFIISPPHRTYVDLCPLETALLQSEKRRTLRTTPAPAVTSSISHRWQTPTPSTVAASACACA